MFYQNTKVGSSVVPLCSLRAFPPRPSLSLSETIYTMWAITKKKQNSFRKSNHFPSLSRHGAWLWAIHAIYSGSTTKNWHLVSPSPQYSRKSRGVWRAYRVSKHVGPELEMVRFLAIVAGTANSKSKQNTRTPTTGKAGWLAGRQAGRQPTSTSLHTSKHTPPPFCKAMVCVCAFVCIAEQSVLCTTAPWNERPMDDTYGTGKVLDF